MFSPSISLSRGPADGHDCRFVKSWREIYSTVPVGYCVPHGLHDEQDQFSGLRLHLVDPPSELDVHHGLNEVLSAGCFSNSLFRDYLTRTSPIRNAENPLGGIRIPIQDSHLAVDHFM